MQITPFQYRIYQLLKRVPKGKVTTYAALAKALGGGSLMARAVGNALNKNPFAPKVPCHRVVKSDGTLGGFALGTEKKKEILEKEGIGIENGKITHFSTVLFAPTGHLRA